MMARLGLMDSPVGLLSWKQESSSLTGKINKDSKKRAITNHNLTGDTITKLKTSY